MYKLTDKAIKEQFYMLSDFTIEMINDKVNAAIEDAEKNGAKKPEYMLVELSRIAVAFKNPEMNKLFDAVASYKFRVFFSDLEEEEFPKELKEITTGVWYDVSDILNDEYDLEEALDGAYDVLVCDKNADAMGLDDNFTSSSRNYDVGYLDEHVRGYVFVTKCHEYDLRGYDRLMFIPAETPEEE